MTLVSHMWENYVSEKIFRRLNYFYIVSVNSITFFFLNLEKVELIILLKLLLAILISSSDLFLV